MKDEVFTGNIDELLEHVINNDDVLTDAVHAEWLAELQVELDQMVEDGLIEFKDGQYRLID